MIRRRILALGAVAGALGLQIVPLAGAQVAIADDDGARPARILLSDTAVSVSGPASTPTGRSFAGPLPRITMTNCGDSTVEIDGRGTDASGPGATWELTNASSGGGIDSTCELGDDLYRADVTLWLPSGGGVGTPLTTSAARLLGLTERRRSRSILPRIRSSHPASSCPARGAAASASP